MTRSSTLRSSSTPRRTTGLATLLALVVALSFGLVTSVSADPTPIPGPSAAPTDPSSSEPTAEGETRTPAVPEPTTPDPTTESSAPSEPVDEEDETPGLGTVSPTQSSTPFEPSAASEPEPNAEPSATSEPEGSGDESSAAADLSAARTMLLSQARSGPFLAAGITPKVAVSEGGNLLSLSIPGCAPVGGTATLDGLIGFIDEEQVSQDESLDWQVEGPGFSRLGTVSFEDGVGEFRVTGLARGEYTLVFSLEGGVQLEDAFTVIDCVTTTVSCAAITFTNPSSNPAVTVDFGPVIDGEGYDDESGDAVEVAPGQTVTGYIGYPNIGWSARWSDPIDFDGTALPQGIFRISSAGEVDDVAIPQDGCAARVTAAGYVCNGTGEPKEVSFTVAKLEPLRLYYEVWERSGRSPVVDGEIAPGTTTVSEKVRVPGAAAYEIWLYVEKAEDPYVVSDLDLADDCPRPSAAPTTGEDDLDADHTDADAAPVSGGAVLADTGSSTGLPGLAGIGVLLVSGVAMVITGRRRQRS